MSQKRTLLVWCCASLFLPVARIAYADYVPQPAEIQQKTDHQENYPGASGISLTPELLKTGLYSIHSEGGANTVLRLNASGSVLVDGQPLGNYHALRAKLGKISDQPVRLLILTSDDPDKTGTDTGFIQAGAHIFANQNLRSRLLTLDPAIGLAEDSLASDTAKATTSDGSGVERSPRLITYDREQPLRVGGVELELLHFGNAHTDGDTVVYFPSQKAIAVGELYASTPDFDFARGGSLVGWGPVLAEILKLDFDMVIPGTGAPVSKADLEAYKKKIETLTSRATALVKQGVPENLFAAQLKTDDLDWHFNFTPQQISYLYSEISNAK
jgi:cyclase